MAGDGKSTREKAAEARAAQLAAEKRWETERELRARLKVSVTERKKLEKFLNERFA